jgi:hypothetical protein
MPLVHVPQGSRGAQEPFFDGPAAWEEVDTEELERIAVNIMRSVVPSTENLEVGARLAMQAAAMEADNQDPLGLGRIDTRQLALVGPPSRISWESKEDHQYLIPVPNYVYGLLLTLCSILVPQGSE